MGDKEMAINWFLGFLLVLVVLFFINNFKKKRRYKNLISEIRKSWGKKKEDEYFNFEDISRYFRRNNHKKSVFHVISDQTSLDLDINEVFKFIDRTSSKIGQQFLYNKIRTIRDYKGLVEFNSFSKQFQKEESTREETQILLADLNNPEAYALEELINGVQIEKPKILWLIYSLSCSAALLIVLGFIYPAFFIGLIPVFLINLVFHYKNKADIGHYLGSINELSKALVISKKLKKSELIQNYFKDLSFIKEISSIKFSTEFIRFEKKFDSEFYFLMWVISELIKITFNIEYVIFYSFIYSITAKRDSIEKMYLFIGEIDAAISTASLMDDEIQQCTPVFTEQKEVKTNEITHPLIDQCVSNDISLTGKSVLLTGSNMSGKTTFIRSVAINALLAQTLNICFAKEYSAPFFKIYSSIRITDDLLQNTSYYLGEVLAVKNIIEASESDSPCLFVLDELFKGTNTVERISGGKAILSYLNKGNNLVLVSTHDIELTELLESESYELFHFSEKVESNELSFDHKLKRGKLKTRNAIKILELYNYPEEIISEAKKIEQENFR
ncbi:DNA mismatch repair protein MutS [Vicingaceae bacterium]|nr:DNA mismatch repair protein MutS [Vicingaceae bacterium]